MHTPKLLFCLLATLPLQMQTYSLSAEEILQHLPENRDDALLHYMQEHKQTIEDKQAENISQMRWGGGETTIAALLFIGGVYSFITSTCDNEKKITNLIVSLSSMLGLKGIPQLYRGAFDHYKNNDGYEADVAALKKEIDRIKESKANDHNGGTSHD